MTCPRCGAKVEATVERWYDVNAKGELVDNGLGGLVKVYCANDHDLAKFADTDTPTAAEVIEGVQIGLGV